MSEETDLRTSRSKQKWLTIFSLFLWAQLIFSGGLTLWRYYLIYTQNWPVYPSNNGPQLEEFAEFIKTTCKDGEAIGYVSTEYNSFARLNYELYPQLIHNLSDLPETDIQTIMAEKEIRCLVYDYALETKVVEGTRYYFSDEQFVLRVETTK